MCLFITMVSQKTFGAIAHVYETFRILNNLSINAGNMLRIFIGVRVGNRSFVFHCLEELKYNYFLS